MLQTLNLAARILNFGLCLLLPGNERGTFIFALLDNLREFADALFERGDLLLKRRRQLFVRREGDLALGQRGVRRIARLPEIFQLGGKRNDRFLSDAFAGFEIAQVCRQRLAFLQTFLLLRRETLDFKNHRLNFLMQQTVGVLQRLELAFARGDGDFLHAQLRLRRLQRGLQFGLLAQQFAPLAARVLDEFLQLGQLRLEFGNLVLTTKNGTGCLAVAALVQVTAGVNAVTIQQFAAHRNEIAACVAVLNLRRGGVKIGGNKRAAKQRFQKRLHLRLGVNDAHRVNNLAALQASLRFLTFLARSHFADKRKLLFVLILLDGQCRHAGATRLVRVQIRENLLRRRRLLREHQL